jgi:hypothetical protein
MASCAPFQSDARPKSPAAPARQPQAAAATDTGPTALAYIGSATAPREG